jgi:hypothetical protein
MTFRYGKLAATKPFGLRELDSYAQGPLPAPPAHVDYSDHLPLPLDGNDTYGDCVAAGMAHMCAVWDDEVKVSGHVPGAAEVVSTYLRLTGGADVGLNESDVLHRWTRSSIFQHTIAAYTPVPMTNVEAIHQTIAFYGASMFGIQCPASAQEQFAAGEPWTVVPGATVEGGHCIVAIGYDAEYVYCATWGGIAPVSYPFLNRYLDESWCIIPDAFVKAGRGPLLDLGSLKADIARL